MIELVKMTENAIQLFAGHKKQILETEKILIFEKFIAGWKYERERKNDKKNEK